MKIKNFLAIMMVALCAVSCSNDDDSNSVNLSEAVAGTYTVYTSASVMGTSLVNNNETVTLTAATGNTNAALSYKGTWGEASTTELTVTAAANGDYAVKGNGNITASMGDGAHAGTYEFTVEGTIGADKKTADLTFAIELGAMGTVTVSSGLGNAPASLFWKGTYTGYTSAAFSYSPTPTVTEGEKVTITANEDGTVNVVLVSGAWGTTTVSNATATVAEDGTYSLAGSGISVIESSHTGTTNNYECTLTGTTTVDKENVEMTFTLSIMGGTTITFHEGDAPAAE